jgi:glycerol-3-phosphate dehydrogenase
VTKRIYDHEKCYFFQGQDGRIIFAIPYETDFTLIGTTDADHSDPSIAPVCSAQEQAYLLNFANAYFKTTLTDNDIVWRYSGVRPLFDEGAENASSASRDYTLKLDRSLGAPVLNVFGGKITTYRRLANSALDQIQAELSHDGTPWTHDAALPGGAFPVTEVDQQIDRLRETYPFLDNAWAKRLIRAYGTDAHNVLGDARSAQDLGLSFGASLSEREVRWLMTHEFARTADDVLWRRSKLGLRLSQVQRYELAAWMKHAKTDQAA